MCIDGIARMAKKAKGKKERGQKKGRRLKIARNGRKA
jgi:hypothetical protein